MASKRVSKEFKEEFTISCTNYDAVTKAISELESIGAEGKELQPLKALKQKLEDSLSKSRNRLLKSMTLSDNIVHLNDSWYGVRYYDDDANSSLHVALLNEGDLHVLRRDCRKERELTTSDIQTLAPACEDVVSVGFYQREVATKSKDYMPNSYVTHEVTNPDIQYKDGNRDMMDSLRYAVDVVSDKKVGLMYDYEPTSRSGSTSVSYHAGGRYVQRILSLYENDITEAEKYFKHHYNELVGEIRERHVDSELLWYEEDEAISFLLGKDNLVFVEGNNNIITLYVLDFGFTVGINRTIVMEQVKVLRERQEQLEEQERVYRELADDTDRKLSLVEDDISHLKSQLVRAESLQAELQLTKERANKDVQVAISDFTKEFNKLFKKWKSRV